jgi:hypothetical protein
MTTKTAAEISLMSPEEIAEWRRQEEINVFGVGFKRDAQGRPIEQGIGAPGNETETHFLAMEKYEGKAAADKARAAAAARRK